MKHLTFLLFAALLTISIIDVGAGIEEGGSSDQPHSTAPHCRPKQEPLILEVEGTIEPKKLKTVLGPISPDISFSDVFARIFSSVKRGDIDTDNAVLFAKRMKKSTEEKRSYYSQKCCKIFEDVMRLFHMHVVERNEINNTSIREQLITHYSKMVNNILDNFGTPMLLQLNKSMENLLEGPIANAEALAADVATALLSGVVKEDLGSPYEFVIDALE